MPFRSAASNHHFKAFRGAIYIDFTGECCKRRFGMMTLLSFIRKSCEGFQKILGLDHSIILPCLKQYTSMLDDIKKYRQG